MQKLSELDDKSLVKLIDNRWQSSESVWEVVQKTYDANLRYYKNEPDWLSSLPKKYSRVRSNRIFVDTEAVINSLIANPPRPNLVAGRDTPESKKLASLQEKYFGRKYDDLNVKETIRKGLRNLYLSRLIVLKPFWNAKINDFDVRSLDPRKVRMAKYATKEAESEFFIEELDDNLLAILRRFPKKAEALKKQEGYGDDDGDERILIENPSVTYKEAWIRDLVIFKCGSVILGKTRNPYWDWDGLLVTEQEDEELRDLAGEKRGNKLDEIREQQKVRKATLAQKSAQTQGSENESEDMQPTEDADESESYYSYFFNHFDHPRKPYIIATVFNNENSPIGQTDMISQAIPLQESVDRRKRQIDSNAEIVNGQIKVDSTVMGKDDAQKLRWETGGIIWGKNVATGVQRETGPALPSFVFDDMQDSRNEIDNIMAASSAFRGERQGQETKGGRQTLVEQSFLRLNELVQVVDYVNYELFNWFYQLAKVRYTEHHYAKTLGKSNALEIIALIQDDFEDGTEVRIFPGKTLPEDQEFMYERAQKDVQAGILSPVDYFEEAGYDSPDEKAKNAVMYEMNKPVAVGITPEEMQQLAPEQPPQEDIPKLSISYTDLPPDGKVQAAAKAGITLDPHILVASEMHANNMQKAEKGIPSPLTPPQVMQTPPEQQV